MLGVVPDCAPDDVRAGKSLDVFEGLQRLEFVRPQLRADRGRRRCHGRQSKLPNEAVKVKLLEHA